MPSRKVRTTGRRPLIGVDDIVTAGRQLGLSALSLHAVAKALGVSPTALYRHVDGRWGLERLVGENILADLDLGEDPAHDLERHLLSFAVRLHDFTRRHPGLASYLQVLFPRGDQGRRLLAAEVAALVRRGYDPPAAAALCSAVATLTISLAASQESDDVARSSSGFVDERSAAVTGLDTDPVLEQAHEDFPQLDTDTSLRLLLTAAVRGLVLSAPPGRPLIDVLDDLSSTGKDL